MFSTYVVNRRSWLLLPLVLAALLLSVAMLCQLTPGASRRSLDFRARNPEVLIARLQLIESLHLRFLVGT